MSTTPSDHQASSNKRRLVTQYLATAFLAFFALTGCGGGGGDSGGGATPATTKIPVTMLAATNFTYVNTDSTSAAKGLGLNITAGALSTSDAVISVQVNKQPPPLSSNAVAAGIVFTSSMFDFSISSGTTIKLPMAISLPYDKTLSPNEPTVLYWNPGTKKYEGVQVIGYDPVKGTVTFLTAHFSGYVAVAFKEIQSLPAAITTPFDRTLDEIRPINFGTYKSTIGDCVGITVLQQWYYGQRMLGYASGIRPDSAVANSKNQFGDDIAIFASSIAMANIDQQNAAWQAELVQAQTVATFPVGTNIMAVANSVYAGMTALRASWMVQTILQLQSTQAPVALMVNEGQNGHAVLAYAANRDVNGNWNFSIADSNFPYGYCFNDGCDLIKDPTIPAVTINGNLVTGEFTVSNALNTSSTATYGSTFVGLDVIAASTIGTSFSGDALASLWRDSVIYASGLQDDFYSGAQYHNFLGQIQVDNMLLYNTGYGQPNSALCLTDNLGICALNATQLDNATAGWIMRYRNVPQSTPNPIFAQSNTYPGSDFTFYRMGTDQSLQVIFGATGGPFKSAQSLALERSYLPADKNGNYSSIRPFGDYLFGHKSVTVTPAKLEIDKSQFSQQISYGPDLHHLGIVAPIKMVLNAPSGPTAPLWSESSPAGFSAGFLAKQFVTISPPGSKTALLTGSPTALGPVVFPLGNSYDVSISTNISHGTAGNYTLSMVNQLPVTSIVRINVPPGTMSIDLPATITSGPPGCGQVAAATYLINVVAEAAADTYTLSSPSSSQTLSITLVPDGKERTFRWISATNNQLFTYTLHPDLTLTGQVSWVTSDLCTGSRPFATSSSLQILPANQVIFGTYDYGTFVPAN